MLQRLASQRYRLLVIGRDDWNHKHRFPKACRLAFSLLPLAYNGSTSVYRFERLLRAEPTRYAGHARLHFFKGPASIPDDLGGYWFAWQSACMDAIENSLLSRQYLLGKNLRATSCP